MTALLGRSLALITLVAACGDRAPRPRAATVAATAATPPVSTTTPTTPALTDRRGEALDPSHDAPASLTPWLATVKARQQPSEGMVSLDAALHRKLEAAFSTVERGAGVVMDVDGRIRALFSTLPHQTDEALSGRHLATARPGPCGSAAKPITALAALVAGALTPTTRHHCAGHLVVGKRKFHCFGEHGDLDMGRALAISDNVFFFEVARHMAHDDIANTQRSLGLGSVTPLLPQAPSGFVPDQKHFEADGQTMRIGHTLTQSIGHNIHITPLQLARAYAALAVGSLPTLSFSSHAVPSTPLDENWRKHLPPIRKALRETVSVPGGTAYFAENRAGNDDPMPDVAGKTGTAESRHQRGAPSRRIGWFAGWAPADNPRIAFAFRVEAATGREVAKVVLAAMHDAGAE